MTSIERWRFIDTGINDGFLNMAIDEAILDAHLKGSCPPTLRVYGWNPPALSLGYFQNAETEIERERCSELGIDVVRRLSGGHAVLHDDELTYSVVTSEEYGSPQSLVKSYRLLNGGLIAAYGMLGLDVCLTVDDEERPSSAACFSSAGLADLTYRGRKVAGSAQFRTGTALLQHGSLPISLDTQLLFSILKFPSTAIRDRAQACFGQKANTLSEILGNKIGWQELKEALFKGFQIGLGIELYEDTLTPEEFDLSRKLAEEKYKTFGWNYDGTYETRLVNQTVSPR
jgi:lipoate-protein ligase A